MVGVTESVDNNAPCSVPIKTLVVNQDTLQLWDGKSRVSVVELNGNLVGELLPGLL
jgi:transposase-like protein